MAVGAVVFSADGTSILAAGWFRSSGSLFKMPAEKISAHG